MNLRCPDCGYQGTIDDEKIPDSGCSIVCRSCNNRFFVSRRSDFVLENNAAVANSSQPVMMPKHDRGVRDVQNYDFLKSRISAGLLGIFLGWVGSHRFYLGYIGIGVAQVIVTLFTFGLGGLWGIIEGILILVGTIDKDAQGMPLRD
jgi:predicted Zn finger-like uncharacterized protein